MNAKKMYQISDTNDWIYTGIPINDNAVNNYFINASHIRVNIYASSDTNSDGSLINASQYSWVVPELATETRAAYIAYNQNVGFVKPTVWNGPTSGIIGDPNSVHMEGFRISSGIPGVEIVSQAYAQGLDWLPQVGDGTYCGTMGQNKPLEAIKLDLVSEAPVDELFDFKYRVYIKDSGWTDWVTRGQEVGTPSSGQPIQAMEAVLEVADLLN